MLLHIGENEYVDGNDLIMVLNMRSIQTSDSKTRLSGRNNMWKKISQARTKCLVITDNDVIESPVDSLTLYKREDVLGFARSGNEGWFNPWRTKDE